MRRTTRSNNVPTLLPLMLLAACTQPAHHATQAQTEPCAAVPDAPAAKEPSPAQRGWAFSPRTATTDKGWHPIRDGVVVAPVDDGVAMAVTYHRHRGQAAGVAFELAPEACARLDAIHLRLSVAAKQSLWVCMTDGQGIVWSFPSIQATTGMADFVLAAKDARPDPFQNGGKQVPAAPEWSDMRMLTILDTSGFMGAAAVDCAWRIEGLRGVEANQ